MPTFSDDFARADGALGANWSASNPPWSIVNQTARANNGYNNLLAAQDPGAHHVEVDLLNLAAGMRTYQLFLKADTVSGDHYLVAFEYTPTTLTTTIFKASGWNYAQLSTNTVAWARVDSATFWFDWAVGGALSAGVDGTTTGTASENSYADHEWLGVRGVDTTAWIDTFRCNLGVTRSMEITPDPVWVGGGDVWMLATGSGVEWTIGDPGSSEITTDQGTIVTQLTTSSTTIEFLYHPADYLGPITFTESEFGCTDTINTTLEPPVPGAGAECKLSDNGALMVNTTALLQADNRILTEKLVVHYAPVKTIPTILDDIYMYMRGLYGGDPPEDPDQALLMFLWQTLNGGQDPPVGAWDVTDNMPIKQDTWRTKLDVEAIRGLQDRTLEDVITLVGGSPTIYSNADLMQAIGNITAGSNQDVLDALAAYFGANPPTIEQLGQMVSDISTVAGYTLGDVLDAIAAIQPGNVDLTPVLNKLTLIQPNSDVTLTTIMDQLTGMQNTLANTYNNVVAIRTGLDYTLADVIDRINAIGASLTNAVGAHPPVWPGEAYVTFGATGDLVDDLYIEGPLHGLLLSITAQPVRTQKFMFGNVASWARVGQIIFETDSGEYERSQTFGLDRQVLVPLTMARANGALVRLNEGWEGTYQPWTINESA